MRVFRGIPEHARTATVITVGNFDGIHLGHQALLALLVAKAKELDLPAGVLTFEPHPREYFSPADAPARLSSLRDKLLMLDSAGVDRVYVCRFNARFARLSAEDFIDELLVRRLRARHLFVGDDFRFGAHRQGDFAMLRSAGERCGFTVEAMPTLDIDGERVSSSTVRTALAAGDLERAARQLGRPYSIAGRVCHGDKLGRELGFPTANVRLPHHVPAVNGVFAVEVEGLREHCVAGVANVGVRPTASKRGRARLEVHLFDWNEDCYGVPVRVHFLHRLRAERKFESLEALRTQIAADALAARAWFTAQRNGSFVMTSS